MGLTFAAIAAATIGVAAAAQTACSTPEDCDAARQELGISVFYNGEYPSKGCFAKGDKAFFSIGGTDAEMSEESMAGIQQRIWCIGESSSINVSPSADNYIETRIDTDTDGIAAPTLADAGDDAAEIEVAASAKATTPSDSGASMGAISFSLGVTASAIMAASQFS